MVKYSKEFKEQALVLSDDIGVKKGAEQLGLNYSTLADWRKTRSRKAREERITSDKTPLNERELLHYKVKCNKRLHAVISTLNIF